MKVFVTGGTGFLGTDVVRHLLAEGHQVQVLTRDKTRVPEGALAVEGDLLKSGGWEAQLRECDACVHMVGILREFPDKGITFEKVHYKATVDLLRNCSRVGLKRFVFISANGVEKGLSTGYMRTKAMAEQAVQSSGLHWTILRPSLVYGGPKDKQNFLGLLRENMDKAPAFPYFGDGNYRMAPISTWEVAKSITQALEDPKTYDNIYHLCGSETYTYKALLRLIADAGGYKITLFPVPFWLMGQAAGLLGGFSWFPLTGGMLRMLKEGNDCPSGVSTQVQLEVPAVSFSSWLKTGALQGQGIQQSSLPLEAPSGPVTTVLAPDRSEGGGAAPPLPREAAVTSLLSPAEAPPLTRPLAPEDLPESPDPPKEA